MIKKNGEWVNSATNLCNKIIIKSSLKNRVTASLCHLSLEHFSGINILISQDHYGSAYALLRPQFESFIRSLYFGLAASSNEIEEFINKDKLRPGLKELISKIEKFEPYTENSLSGIMDMIWGPLCSYTHGGAFQLSIRNSESAIENSINDNEISLLLKISNDLALQTIMFFAKVGNESEVAKKAADSHKEIFNIKY